jgi:PhnB protein
MRFLNIITGLTPAANTAPDPAHMARMNKSIAADVAAGAMLATGGIGKRATSAARVILKGGQITLEDPPKDGANGGWMAGGGFALTESPSKEAAIARARETLEMMGQDAMLEMIQVSEMHPAPARAPNQAVGINKGVIPYLNVKDANAAAEFYKKAFGAKEHHRLPAQDGKRLMHCHLEINGGSLMLADCFEEHGYNHQPSHSFTMTLVLEDGEAWFKRALEAGCKVTMPWQRMMWGDDYGSFSDPFEVHWAINQPAKH